MFPTALSLSSCRPLSAARFLFNLLQACKSTLSVSTQKLAANAASSGGDSGKGVACDEEDADKLSDVVSEWFTEPMTAFLYQ